eukprot:TRINITY_DN109274_c0_g1_i1.p1 TRINITY_DN109274_c0_g1~~TRINITY_DN109274_c0_g1_i1.p1  ORF type:complete len:241 (+),score=23.85 TRINITY_DN109274_c0_g1_i1:31-753(+)
MRDAPLSPRGQTLRSQLAGPLARSNAPRSFSPYPAEEPLRPAQASQIDMDFVRLQKSVALEVSQCEWTRHRRRLKDDAQQRQHKCVAELYKHTQHLLGRSEEHQHCTGEKNCEGMRHVAEYDVNYITRADGFARKASALERSTLDFHELTRTQARDRRLRDMRCPGIMLAKSFVEDHQEKSARESAMQDLQRQCRGHRTNLPRSPQSPREPFRSLRSSTPRPFATPDLQQGRTPRRSPRP